jgi:hypothetical protein
MKEQFATSCPVCAGEIRLANIRGEVTPYRDIPRLEIVVDAYLPTCTSCGEQWLGDRETAILDQALEASYAISQSQKRS